MKDNAYKEIELKLIEKLLEPVPDGPLKKIEGVLLPEPLRPIKLPGISNQASPKRGPRSPEDWISEIRTCWQHMDDLDRLAGSWLASLPQVQRMAVSKYGGGVDGKGKALQALLTQALSEARQYKADEKTHAVLSKYPAVEKIQIAKELHISREQFSRNYVSKANKILTNIFIDIVHRLGKAQLNR
jgi:hypothetical protein